LKKFSDTFKGLVLGGEEEFCYNEHLLSFEWQPNTMCSTQTNNNNKMSGAP